MSESPTQVAQKYAFSHYGHLILVDNPIFDDKEKLYVSNIRSDYPLVIKDDKIPEKRFIRILKLDNLGKIIFNEKYVIVKEKTSSRENCIENLKLLLESWKMRAEEIVVSASSDNLVEISRYNHFFDPIESILTWLWDDHTLHNDMLKISRLAYRRKRMRLYLELLEGLQLVRKIENGYIEGNLFNSIRKDEHVSNLEQFIDVVLSHIIRERYPTLRDVFKLTILEPTIHIENCVYLPELEAEEPIFRLPNSIESDYRFYYQKRVNPLDFKLTLSRLEKAKAITRDGKHYSGNEELLINMIKIKKGLPPLNMELITRA